MKPNQKPFYDRVFFIALLLFLIVGIFLFTNVIIPSLTCNTIQKQVDCIDGNGNIISNGICYSDICPTEIPLYILLVCFIMMALAIIWAVRLVLLYSDD